MAPLVAAEAQARRCCAGQSAARRRAQLRVLSAPPPLQSAGRRASSVAASAGGGGVVAASSSLSSLLLLERAAGDAMSLLGAHTPSRESVRARAHVERASESLDSVYPCPRCSPGPPSLNERARESPPTRAGAGCAARGGARGALRRVVLCRAPLHRRPEPARRLRAAAPPPATATQPLCVLHTAVSGPVFRLVRVTSSALQSLSNTRCLTTAAPPRRRARCS